MRLPCDYVSKYLIHFRVEGTPTLLYGGGMIGVGSLRLLVDSFSLVEIRVPLGVEIVDSSFGTFSGRSLYCVPRESVREIWLRVNL